MLTYKEYDDFKNPTGHYAQLRELATAYQGERVPLFVGTVKDNFYVWMAKMFRGRMKWDVGCFRYDFHSRLYNCGYLPEFPEQFALGGTQATELEFLDFTLRAGINQAIVYQAKQARYQRADERIYIHGPRGSLKDVVIFNPMVNVQSLNQLPVGARVGVSSARRKLLLKLHFPKLQPVLIRGSTLERLSSLVDLRKGLDAVIISKENLKRTGLWGKLRDLENETFYMQELDPQEWVPAPGAAIPLMEAYRGSELQQEYVDLDNELSFLLYLLETRLAENLDLWFDSTVPIAIGSYFYNKQGEYVSSSAITAYLQEKYIRRANQDFIHSDFTYVKTATELFDLYSLKLKLIIGDYEGANIICAEREVKLTDLGFNSDLELTQTGMRKIRELANELACEVRKHQAYVLIKNHILAEKSRVLETYQQELSYYDEVFSYTNELKYQELQLRRVNHRLNELYIASRENLAESSELSNSELQARQQQLESQRRDISNQIHELIGYIKTQLSFKNLSQRDEVLQALVAKHLADGDTAFSLPSRPKIQFTGSIPQRTQRYKHGQADLRGKKSESASATSNSSQDSSQFTPPPTWTEAEMPGEAVGGLDLSGVDFAKRVEEADLQRLGIKDKEEFLKQLTTSPLSKEK